MIRIERWPVDAARGLLLMSVVALMFVGFGLVWIARLLNGIDDLLATVGAEK